MKKIVAILPSAISIFEFVYRFCIFACHCSQPFVISLYRWKHDKCCQYVASCQQEHSFAVLVRCICDLLFELHIVNKCCECGSTCVKSPKKRVFVAEEFTGGCKQQGVVSHFFWITDLHLVKISDNVTHQHMQITKWHCTLSQVHVQEAPKYTLGLISDHSRFVHTCCFQFIILN